MPYDSTNSRVSSCWSLETMTRPTRGDGGALYGNRAASHPSNRERAGARRPRREGARLGKLGASLDALCRKPPRGQSPMGQVLPTGFEPVSEAREASILGH